MAPSLCWQVPWCWLDRLNRGALTLWQPRNPLFCWMGGFWIILLIVHNIELILALWVWLSHKFCLLDIWCSEVCNMNKCEKIQKLVPAELKILFTGNFWKKPPKTCMFYMILINKSGFIWVWVWVYDYVIILGVIMQIGMIFVLSIYYPCSACVW